MRTPQVGALHDSLRAFRPDNHSEIQQCMKPHMTAEDISAQLTQIIGDAIHKADGWIGFDHFEALALYQPGLGYYANDLRKFGTRPESGSDFVTAPELSPLFGRTLALQVHEALQASQTREMYEFGAGTGALAQQLLTALGPAVEVYNIIDLSGTLRERQQHTLAPFGEKVRWLHALPDAMQGVVIGNEVLDAMPVKLLARVNEVWHERGVALHAGQLVWADRPTQARPPCEVEGTHDYLTEIQPQAEAFVASVAERLVASERGGAAFFLDYGFPEAEYFHPQRHMGTVMCHQAHKSDMNPLVAVGLKDITAHVNFTGIALAGQDQGLHVLGYTSQARFLLNLGLAEAMAQADLAERSQAQRLMAEHEMGELFKVVGFSTSDAWQASGFAAGDRSHRL
jgi:SAM-dependent MidA family methyltransferase